MHNTRKIIVFVRSAQSKNAEITFKVRRTIKKEINGKYFLDIKY